MDNKTALANFFANPARRRIQQRTLQRSLDQLPLVRAPSRRASSGASAPLSASDPSSIRPKAPRAPVLRLTTDTGNESSAASFAGEATAQADSQLIASSIATVNTSTSHTRSSILTTTTSSTSGAFTTTTTTSATSTAHAATLANTGANGPSGVPAGLGAQAHAPRIRPAVGLYHAIVSGDAHEAARCAASGESIFDSPFDCVFPPIEDRLRSGGPQVTLLEFALARDEYECALEMLRACAPHDRLQCRTRLLDLLDRAMESEAWENVETLLSLLEDLQMQLRSKSFGKIFRALLSVEDMTLARRILELGCSVPLTYRQLTRMAENALRSGSRPVVQLFLRRHAELITSPSCSMPRVLRYANGEALAALLKCGLVLPELDAMEAQTLMSRLLEAGSQELACRVLTDFATLDLARIDLLDVAVRSGAAKFIEDLLMGMPAHAPQWQQGLHEALRTAFKLGFNKAVLLLSAHGVDLFQYPVEALSLISELVHTENSHGLAALVQSKQLPLHSVFLRLANKGKQSVLAELQRIFKLSFSAQMSANLAAPQHGATCSALLAGLLDQLSLAAQDRGPAMLCVLLESGLSYAAAVNFCRLRNRLLLASRSTSSHCGQQLMMAVAASLARLDLPEQFWPEALDGSLASMLRTELYVLQALGVSVLTWSADGLRVQLEHELRRGPGVLAADSGQRLQQLLGLPGPMCALLVEALQEVRQISGSHADLSALPPRLAQAILRKLESTKHAHLPGDPLAAWYLASWDLLGSAARQMSAGVPGPQREPGEG